MYLTQVSIQLSAALFALIGVETSQTRDTAQALSAAERSAPPVESDIEEWERRVELDITQDRTIADTDRRALILARRGQGLFRSNVRTVERACRITRVDRPEHLIASHMRPWRDSNHEQRLDGENGLLLTPTMDHLFDKGFISFENSGALIISPVADSPSLRRMGIDTESPMNVGAFSDGQKRHLDFHRDNILKMAKVNR